MRPCKYMIIAHRFYIFADQKKNDLKQVVVFYGFVTNCTNDCKKKYSFIKYVLYVIITLFGVW